MNGLIHECDRTIRLAFNEEFGEKDQKLVRNATVVVRSPAFYNIYGQAFHQHWYDIFEKYLMFFESLFLKYINGVDKDCVEIKEDLRKDMQVKLFLEKQMAMTLDLAAEKFKRSLSDEVSGKIEPSEDASEEDIELVQVCSDRNSIGAEYMRTYLLHLVFHPSRFETPPSIDSLLEKFTSKFHKALDLRIIFKRQDMQEQVSEMLLEEIQFMIDWLQDLLALSQRWNQLLGGANVTMAEIEAVYKGMDNFEFDGNLQIAESAEDTESDDPVTENISAKAVIDLDASIGFYTLCISSFQSLV